MARWRRVHGKASDRGAAAVEFALVLLPLLLLVMGIVDYGRFFFDSVSLRQGAREGARQAVVQRYGGSAAGGLTLCTAELSVGAKIACTTKAASDVTMGTPKVYIPAITPATTPNWAQGKQLLVCMQSKETGTGFVPLPANGIITTKTYMSIEVGDIPTGQTDVNPYYKDPGPEGWGWCS